MSNKNTPLFRLSILSEPLQDKGSIGKAYRAAFNQAFKATVNKILQRTAPNPGFKEGVRSSKALNQKGIKQLKARIVSQLVGDGIVGSGIAQADFSSDGQILWSTIERGEKAPIMPFVVRKKGVRAPTGGLKPVNITSADGLLQHISKHTIFTRQKHKAAMRTIAPNATYAWTTAAVAKRAAKALSRRAGRLLSGWGALCKVTDHTTQLNKLIASQTQWKADRGKAKKTLKPYGLRLAAENPEAEDNMHFADWQEKVIYDQLEQWVQGDVDRELKYLIKSLNKKAKKQSKKIIQL